MIESEYTDMTAITPLMSFAAGPMWDQISSRSKDISVSPPGFLEDWLETWIPGEPTRRAVPAGGSVWRGRGAGAVSVGAAGQARGEGVPGPGVQPRLNCTVTVMTIGTGTPFSRVGW